MASERQIAANRRNARKSTRPRSGAGKNRSSRNAYRHDLTFGITSTAALAKLLDKLARKIAGDTKDPILLERARAVAQAQFDLARVRQAKAALIERASAFEALDPPRILSPESSVSSMRLTQVESSSRNPSTPRRRCRHKSLTDRLKPSDACCPSCAGWTDTSAALPRGETERFLISW
jgi:hypothetical protein